MRPDTPRRPAAPQTDGGRRDTPWSFVAAPNAYKGALDAVSAAQAIARGVRSALPDAAVAEVPVADGGDGTAAVLSTTLGGRWIRMRAPDPWGRPHMAGFALLGDGETAVIDVAAASGLGGRRPSPADALVASSAGTGALARRAVALGARRVWIALGGSGCTDGGAGLLHALGVRLEASVGRTLPPGGAALADLRRVDLGGLGWATRVEWTALVDVQSPLLGPGGAATVFGPQKGAGPAEVLRLEAGLSRWADALETAAGRRGARALPGAGAAGGCGFALAAALGAELRPGAGAVAAAVGLEQCIAGAAVVLTGEGALDAQTALGKAPAHVARLARAAGARAIALAGVLGPGWESLLRPAGDLDAVLPLAPGPRTRRLALRQTAADLERAAATAARLLAAGAELPRQR